MDVTYVAGAPVSSGNVVYVSAGQVRRFDPTNVALVGLTLGIARNAATTGGNVVVQLMGLFEMSGYGLTPDRVYYAGANGTLVLDPAGLPIVQPVGISLSATQLKINFTSPIKTLV